MNNRTETILARKEDARITRSRAALRNALLALLQRMSFEDITVRDLTDEAGIGSATFYRLFPTKAALLDDIAASEIKLLLDLALPILLTNDSRREASLAQLRHVNDNRALWRALLTGGAASTIRDGIIGNSREVTISLKRVSKKIPSDLVFRFVASATVELLTWWLESGDRVPPEEAAELMDSLIITPLVGPPAARRSRGSQRKTRA